MSEPRKGVLGDLGPLVVPASAPSDLGYDQTLIWDLFEAQKCLAIQKNLDYGSSFRKVPAFAPHIKPGDAILVRMGDKLERLKQLAAREAQVKSESIEDTMLDLGTYCFLWVLERRAIK